MVRNLLVPLAGQEIVRMVGLERRNPIAKEGVWSGVWETESGVLSVYVGDVLVKENGRYDEDENVSRLESEIGGVV